MSKRFFRNSPLLAAALLLIAAAPGPEVREKENREPIVVTSDRMEADELGSTVIFSGGVTLKKETMLLTADHLVGVMDELGRQPSICSHLEMETYTWEVLPAELKKRDVVDQLEHEYAWTLDHLRRRGLA